eukprot:c8131_g1_i1.p1 GENE.c8131_g1_i1~~c8131_g1_i1.p1  ORF type:complete len:411 (-),score=49.88 c8131_g1_i1:309-1541(-)
MKHTMTKNNLNISTKKMRFFLSFVAVPRMFGTTPNKMSEFDLLWVLVLLVLTLAIIYLPRWSFVVELFRAALTDAYPIGVARTLKKLPEPQAKSLDQLQTLISEQEKQYDIIPGAEKSIVWYSPAPGVSAPRKKTPLAIVYIHGWSTCRQDSAPIPDRVANALQANLYNCRLSGHGHHVNEHPEIGGFALFNLATAANLFQDAVDAVNIGRQIGERVLIMGSSTGAMLAIWAACQPCLADHLAGLILMSPAFALRKPYHVIKWANAFLRVMPLGLAPTLKRVVSVAVMGKERIIRPRNSENQTFWTVRYPSHALSNLIDVLWEVESLDLHAVKIPTMIIANPFDDVVCYSTMLKRFEELGSHSKMFMSFSYSHDPHILVGRIMSPNTVDECEMAVVTFAQTYALQKTNVQ